MRLIARIALRHHEMPDGRDKPLGSERSIAIFGLDRGSPQQALALLGAELERVSPPLIALLLGPAVKARDEALVRAVIAESHRRGATVAVCGGEADRFTSDAGGEAGAERWFPSVPQMLQELAER